MPGQDIAVENHPLQPFLPEGARVLFLGSFPPPRERWSMDFFYPNFNNDFWRIMGLLFFGAPRHFESTSEKKFDKDRIETFCRKEGLAFYDTARTVRRLKGNASDAFLEITESSDVPAMLDEIPLCQTVVTTGGKASEELFSIFSGLGCAPEGVPPVGGCVRIAVPLRSGIRNVTWYRMPSSSRAYPMKLEKKAEYYLRIDALEFPRTDRAANP
jgi:G:T/U-mismatch repair DNA glycosylase